MKLLSFEENKVKKIEGLLSMTIHLFIRTCKFDQEQTLPTPRSVTFIILLTLKLRSLKLEERLSRMFKDIRKAKKTGYKIISR